jgi:hypothetical protein
MIWLLLARGCSEWALAVENRGCRSLELSANQSKDCCIAGPLPCRSGLALRRACASLFSLELKSWSTKSALRIGYYVPTNIR